MMKPKKKNYYNQQALVSSIHLITPYPKCEITAILQALSAVVQQLFESSCEDMEIKIIPGLKLSCISYEPNTLKSNLFSQGYVNQETKKLQAQFTKDYKRKINQSLQRQADTNCTMHKE